MPDSVANRHISGQYRQWQKGNYSHYDVVGDWAGHAQRYGRTDALWHLIHTVPQKCPTFDLL